MALLTAAALLCGAGCGGSPDRTPTSAATPAPTTSSVVPTTTAAPAKLTLADLAQHPCRGLTDEQMNKLLVIPTQSQEGGEQETGFRQCQWGTVQGQLLFGPHPTLDMTADPRVADLEPGDLDGHRTMLGVDTSRDSCMMYVSVADQQSFQVAILPDADQHLGMGGCDLIKELAGYVLANLA
jgi:hypothetical protein